MQMRTYELAGIGDRALALLIDSIIVGAVGGLIGVGSAAIWGGSLLGAVLGAGYQWYFLTKQDGQTPGKMLMGIQVIKRDGTQISDGEAVLRYVGYLVNSAVAMIGWIWALFDSNNRGWHDMIANTYVVKVPKGARERSDYVDIYDEKQKNEYL